MEVIGRQYEGEGALVTITNWRKLKLYTSPLWRGHKRPLTSRGKQKWPAS